jgi:hypothetical protein
MMQEFKTLHFPNTPEGQRLKIQTLEKESSRGWKVVSENIEAGKFKGGTACFLFALCAPLALTAGHHEGRITITLSREIDPNAPKEAAENKGEILYTKTDIPMWTCGQCFRTFYATTKVCPDCKLSQEEVAIRDK